MAITRLGFAGPMSAYGPFTDKEEGDAPSASVAGYAAWQSAVVVSSWLLWLLLGGWR